MERDKIRANMKKALDKNKIVQERRRKGKEKMREKHEGVSGKIFGKEVKHCLHRVTN